jgi:hypothetical protein
VNELLAGLEATPLAAALRGSVYLYPLVNTAHIAGIALLVGAVAALDLRLIGAWRAVPAAALTKVLVPVAATGLGLAVIAGVLLFVCKATEYAVAPLFQAKMVLLVLALANAGIGWRLLRRGDSPALRLSAATSLAVWLTVLLLGRLVGYF